MADERKVQSDQRQRDQFTKAQRMIEESLAKRSGSDHLLKSMNKAQRIFVFSLNVVGRISF